MSLLHAHLKSEYFNWIHIRTVVYFHQASKGDSRSFCFTDSGIPVINVFNHGSNPKLPEGKSESFILNLKASEEYIYSRLHNLF